MRQKKGTITSVKMTGTVTVTVDRSIFHSVYKKSFKRSSKFLADTADFTDLAVGDRVVISECRPLSKRKRFRISDVVARVPRVSEMQNETDVERETNHDTPAEGTSSSDA